VDLLRASERNQDRDHGNEKRRKGTVGVFILGKHACGKAGKRGLKREGELVLGDIVEACLSVLRHAPRKALPEGAL